VVTAAYALLGLFALVHLPSNPFWTVVSLVLVAALVVLFGLLGHATLVWIQRAATWLFGIFTLVIAIILLGKTNWTQVLAAPAGPWDTGVLSSFIIVMAATGIGWINAGSDYTRYFPRRTKGGPIILWTVVGGTLPLFVLMLVGVLISGLLPNLGSASNPIQVIGQALPAWMAVPYLVTAVGGLIVAAALDIYSSGLNLLTLGVKAPRYATVLIDGVLMTAGSIYVTLIAQNFYGPFVSFLQLLADGLMAWVGVFLIDMIWRRTYDPASLVDTTPRGRYFYQGGFNLIACIAWLAGVVVGLLFTASPFFNGPFATGIFASTSLGYLIGAAVSAVLYLVLRLATHASRHSELEASGGQ
jgi:purine-cytosine permease-like protein